jgi:hypothetical protein
MALSLKVKCDTSIVAQPDVRKFFASLLFLPKLHMDLETHCHCERSEAISVQVWTPAVRDRHVAALLAMTV